MDCLHLKIFLVKLIPWIFFTWVVQPQKKAPHPKNQLGPSKKEGQKNKRMTQGSGHIFYFHPEPWGKWSNFDALFFRWVGSTTNWMFPKIVVPPKSSIFDRIFHYFHHPFWDTTIFGNTQLDDSYRAKNNPSQTVPSSQNADRAKAR